MATKICSLCKIEKDISEFRYRKDKDWFLSQCKKCESKRVMETRDSEKTQERRKDYYDNHKQIEKENHQKYRKNNPKYFVERYQIYYKYNKETLISKANKRNKEKRKNDPVFRIRQNISAMIRNQIKKDGKSITKFLPYTLKDLRDHLESQFEPWMTWNNHGIYRLDEWDDNNQETWKWQLDHIIPHSTFKYFSMENEEFKKCWALENLRPLSAKQNVLDGVKRIRHPQ